jgi:hypothetical protein
MTITKEQVEGAAKLAEQAISRHQMTIPEMQAIRLLISVCESKSEIKKQSAPEEFQEHETHWSRFWG